MVWPTLGSRTAKEQNRTDLCNNWSPTVLTTLDDPPEGYVLSIGTRTTELRVQEQWLIDYQRKLVNVLGWASSSTENKASWQVTATAAP